MKKKFLEVGKIVTTHGIKGEVKVEPWCNSGDFLCSFSRVFLNNGEKEMTVLSSRVQKNMVIMSFEKIRSVDQAEQLRSQVLYINRDDIDLPAGEWFIEDLLGADVINSSTRKHYGKLTDVIKTGANDVYEVTAEDNKNYLVPVINDVVRNIDIDRGVIEIFPLKGIFNDED